MRLAMIAATLLGLSAPAALAAPPVLVELFTSQSCSSCPPADALLARLAQRPDLLALDFHVTYWDRLGWKDPFSLAEATERQRGYAARLGLDEVYTPQLVAGGRHQVVGSDPGAVEAAVAAARAEAGPPVPLLLRGAGQDVALEIGPGSGSATLWLAGFDPQHTTHVRGGENGGRTLSEVDVVRGITPVAAWHGTGLHLTAHRPAGERLAAFLQAEDGRVLAVAVLPPG